MAIFGHQQIKLWSSMQSDSTLITCSYEINLKRFRSNFFGQIPAAGDQKVCIRSKDAIPPHPSGFAGAARIGNHQRHVDGLLKCHTALLAQVMGTVLLAVIRPKRYSKTLQ